MEISPGSTAGASGGALGSGAGASAARVNGWQLAERLSLRCTLVDLGLRRAK